MNPTPDTGSCPATPPSSSSPSRSPSRSPSTSPTGSPTAPTSNPTQAPSKEVSFYCCFVYEESSLSCDYLRIPYHHNHHLNHTLTLFVSSLFTSDSPHSRRRVQANLLQRVLLNRPRPVQRRQLLLLYAL